MLLQGHCGPTAYTRPASTPYRSPHGRLARPRRPRRRRFGVKKTGCSGWQYVADLAKASNDDDRIFLQDDVRIYVDQASLAIVDGTEIDLVRQKLGEQFVFRNPNVRGECGCGESFTTAEHD